MAVAAAAAELTGMEPLSSIPGSVGGACYMNAGTYGSSMADVLESVRVYKPSRPVEDGGICGSGAIIDFDVDELNLGYRKSRIADDGFIVLSATFRLAPGNAAMIRADMDGYRERREEKQPLERCRAPAPRSNAPRATSSASSSWTRGSAAMRAAARR